MVGETVRTLRNERGLTQERLAELAGLDRTTVVNFESGRRGVLYERLFDIADALEVPMAELVREKRPTPDERCPAR